MSEDEKILKQHKQDEFRAQTQILDTRYDPRNAPATLFDIERLEKKIDILLEEIK